MPEDLQAAGFYTLVADYPLAPPHTIQGQANQVDDPRSGRPPQQTNAIEAVIRAARSDSHCLNFEVGVLGGSAGAAHAAFVTLNAISTGDTWPNWSESDRPTCAVCLSGQYDYAERDLDVQDSPSMLIHDIENYTDSIDPTVQYAASPVSLIPLPTGVSYMPMYFFRSMDDPGSPPSEQYYLWNALTNASVDPSLSNVVCPSYREYRSCLRPLGRLHLRYRSGEPQHNSERPGDLVLSATLAKLVPHLPFTGALRVHTKRVGRLNTISELRLVSQVTTTLGGIGIKAYYRHN